MTISPAYAGDFLSYRTGLSANNYGLHPAFSNVSVIQFTLRLFTYFKLNNAYVI